MSNWYCKIRGGYAPNTNEAQYNATRLREVLEGYGWSLNAICGFLGNVQLESGLNPWRYQGDNVQSTATYYTWNGGYGLVQYTKPKKYIDGEYDGNPHPNVKAWVQALPEYGPNFSDRTGSLEDGDAQLIYLNNYNDYRATSRYPYSFEEFKSLELDLETMVLIWLKNFERAGVEAITSRVNYAHTWWDYFQGGPLPPPGPIPGGNLPIWLLFKLGGKI